MLNLNLYKDFSVKAKCNKPKLAEEILLKNGAKFMGTDTQNDVYFKTAVGKLKLRQGHFENILIHYERAKANTLMQTRVYVFQANPDKKKITTLYDTREVIGKFKKERKIFFLDNVKIHLDKTDAGEFFIEIEAIDADGKFDTTYLQKQCEHYLQLLNVNNADILADGYFKKVKR